MPNSEYKPGSITKIKLKNFLTYFDVVIHPGPRLNVVIGPNGSGKSSILCALCLGLGGSPTLLGRADDVREFIAHDQDEGYIEITLSGISSGSRGDVVKRTLVRSDKGGVRSQHGEFFVNGRAESKKNVQSMVENKYRIDVANLLSFLPQDKVGNFSSYTPQQLLGETMKALNERQLFDVHQKLMKIQNESKDQTRSVQTIGEKLEALKQENEGLEKSKAQLEERKRNLDRMKPLEAKFKWLKFDSERQRALALKKERDEAKKEMEKATSNVPVLERAKADVEAQIDDGEDKMGTFQKTNEKIKKEVGKLNEKGTTITSKVEDIITEITNLAKEQLKKEKKAEQKEKELESLTKKLEESNVDEIEKELAPLNAEYKTLSKHFNTLSNKKVEVESLFNAHRREYERAKRAYQELSEIKKQKLNKIYRKRPALQKAVKWVTENQEKFRKPVYGPVGAELDCASEDIAKIVDQHVSNAVLMAFVCETKEDSDFLYRNLREKMKIPGINIELCENSTMPQREYSSSRMKGFSENYGIKGFLDRFIKGPPTVIKALCNSSKIHTVLVGDQTTAEEIDKPGTPGRPNAMEDFSTRDNGNPQSACVCFKDSSNTLYRYMTNVSRYTKKINTSVGQIKEQTYFVSKGVDPKTVKERKDKVMELKDKYTELSDEITEVGADQKEASGKIKVVKGKMEKLRKQRLTYGKIISSKEAAEKKLEQLRAEAAGDIESEKKKLIAHLKKLIDSSTKSSADAKKRWGQLMDNTFLVAGILVDVAGRGEEKQRIMDLLNEEEEKAARVKENYEKAKQEFAACKENLRELKRTAELEAQLVDEDGNDLPLKVALEGLPESLEEIQSAIQDCKDQVNAVIDDPHLLAEYERKKKEIAELTEALADKSAFSDAKNAEMTSLETPFRAKLQNYIATIDTRFSEYMAELHCAGGVKLDEGINGSYNEWGIQIQVKYRQANSLQVLDARVHSGGERSVATIMYLMALQDQLTSPFRCVDEINQGMDEIFERQVFSRVVKNSCAPLKLPSKPAEHSGQYFLITPKLLPNLTAMENEDVTVLIIFNGPYMNLGHIVTPEYIRKRKSLGNGYDDGQGAGDGGEGDVGGGGSRKKTKSKRKEIVVEEEEEVEEEDELEVC